MKAKAGASASMNNGKAEILKREDSSLVPPLLVPTDLLLADEGTVWTPQMKPKACLGELEGVICRRARLQGLKDDSLGEENGMLVELSSSCSSTVF